MCTYAWQDQELELHFEVYDTEDIASSFRYLHWVRQDLASESSSSTIAARFRVDHLDVVEFVQNYLVFGIISTRLNKLTSARGQLNFMSFSLYLHFDPISLQP